MIESGPTPEAFDVHFEDHGVVDETVDRGDGHRLVREDRLPGSKWLIGGDHERASLVSGGDELEQNAGFGLVLVDVGQIVEDQEVELVELLDRRRQCELLAGNLELLNEIGGSGEENPEAVFDQSIAESGAQVRLSRAGRPEAQDVGALLQPGIAGSQRHDVGLADHGNRGEVEAVEGFAGGQAGLDKVALNAPLRPLGDFQLGQGGQKPFGGPAFAVGASGELGPQAREGGKTQARQHERQLRGIDGYVAHRATPEPALAKAGVSR